MEISSSKNNEQLVLNLAYSYTEQYNHRKIPEGTYSSEEINSNVSLTAIRDGVIKRESERRAEEEARRQDEARKTAVIGAKQVAFAQADLAREALSIPSLQEAAKEINGPFRALKVFGIIFLVVALCFFALKLYANYVERQRRKRRRRNTR